MDRHIKRERIERAVASRVWAIVGANNNPRKFGNIIYKDMRAAGYQLYPVNPNCREVEGDRAYPTLLDLPMTPDVVDLVVPARIGLKIAADAARAGIDLFWLQPGAESPELIAKAEELGLDLIYHACCMVEKRRWE
jgi:predicted CoA-binding protein